MARPSRIVRRTGALPGRSSPNPRNDEELISTLLNNISVSFPNDHRSSHPDHSRIPASSV